MRWQGRVWEQLADVRFLRIHGGSQNGRAGRCMSVCLSRIIRGVPRITAILRGSHNPLFREIPSVPGIRFRTSAQAKSSQDNLVVETFASVPLPIQRAFSRRLPTQGKYVSLIYTHSGDHKP